MCVLKKGLNVRKKFSIATIIAIAVLSTICTATPSHAQQNKPQLVPITLNKDTTEQKALETAKKLAPKYFNLKEDKKGLNKYSYFARFITYNNTRFLALKITDSYFLCSRLGCPIKLYVEDTKNKWRLLGNFQTYEIVFDINSENKKYPNIILMGFEQVQKQRPPVLMWNGLKYTKVN